jgi:uncharacterized repeat protein (TIGR01451 family)
LAQLFLSTLLDSHVVRVWLWAGVFAFFSSTAFAQIGVTNTAVITPPATVSNSNPSVSCTAGVCYARDIDTVTSSADMSIVKTAGNLTPSAGGTLTYSLVISNAGPSTATGASFADNLPAGLGHDHQRGHAGQRAGHDGQLRDQHQQSGGLGDHTLGRWG